MLEVYRDDAPPQTRAPALKPKLRSWTGRVWRWHPQGYQLMLKIEASVAPGAPADALKMRPTVTSSWVTS